MNYIKIVNGERHCKPASKIVIIKDDFQYFNPTEEMLIEDGWVKEENVVNEISEEDILHNNAMEEIEFLKESLMSTDYKVIKCMEAFLCNEELPYNITELHQERDKQRKRIEAIRNNEISNDRVNNTNDNVLKNIQNSIRTAITW